MEPPRRERVLLSWSSGKDSAWCLRELRAAPGVEVVGLLSTLDRAEERVAMHAVRRELLRLQAAAAGLPLWEVELPSPCPNAAYEAEMQRVMERAARDEVGAVAFGDLFLEDVRRFREEKLAGTGVRPLFPLWGRDTRALAEEMIAGGLVAHLTSVDPRQVAGALCGRRFDGELLAELPASADPCGEKGEFHTFVSAGPMLGSPVAVRAGEVYEQDGFVRCDLLPA